jgi:hypothetical protein
MNKPWTRWWWLGSAVDKQNISDLLTQYHDAGVGGVEICPIYGAKGAESRYINDLTPKWMEMLDHTTAEGKRLDMGVDMTTGTGWPMGGPEISSANNSDNIAIQTYPVAAGKTLAADLSGGTLSHLEAVSDAGQNLDLTARVHGGKLDWTAPDGNWTVYAVSYTPTNFQVKRSAPGAREISSIHFPSNRSTFFSPSTPKLSPIITAFCRRISFTIHTNIRGISRRNYSSSSKHCAVTIWRENCRPWPGKARMTRRRA